MTKLIPVLCGVFLVCAFPAAAPAQSITNQPQSITVNNASTATFTVGASNALTYQWQFNGSDISGETNSSLTLEDVMTNRQGNYTVVINGSVTSSPPAVLTIVPGTIVTFTFSGLLTNASSNIDVQLFDHDKPATVRNFIHYIQAGGYTNMFFDRCVPGFVLQGGDYGASNRTSTTPPLTGWFITAQFTDATNQPAPPYPAHIDSEFNVGPLIHNRFGTIAMALSSGDQNSANNAFYFNLADNSANLDVQTGGFTVFGRILDGTNVLQYFNTLSNDFGEATNGEIIFADGLATNQLATLPVNYVGTSEPANSNLVFCDFSFLAPPPVDTNLPTVAITSPAAPALLTNGMQGTASDSVGLALVVSVLTPQAASDGTYPYPYTNGAPETNYATGTTNWSLSLSPGSYSVSVQSQNGSGYFSAATNQAVSATGVVIDGEGTVNLMLSSNVTVNAVGYPLQTGGVYDVKAIPGPGQTFLNWNYQSTISTNADLPNFPYQGGILTATFIQTNTPKGTKGISFTYPTANATLQTNNFLLRGKIAASVKSAEITCQIYSLTSFEAVGPALTTSGTNTWSVAVSNLPPDVYLVQAIATNATGFASVISEKFTVLAFKGAAGTYNGLFLCTTGPVAPTNSGFITITVADSGAYSAKLFFPAYPPITTDYRFSIGGTSDSPFHIFPGNPLQLDFTLDLTGGTETMTGTISAYSGQWSSDVVCYRADTKLTAHTTPATGKYIFSLDPTNWPNTNGFATLTIGSGGTLALSGVLPDGAAFSQSARVSTNGVWPLYVAPAGYKTNGMLMGWETNLASGEATGQLYWYKAPNVGAYYTSGINTNVTATGTNYSPPAAGNYSIVFQGGTISVPVTNGLTMTRAGGQFGPGSTADKLAISLSAGGALTGHFVNTNNGNTLQFKGAFFGQSQGGSGFILENNGRTGYFVLLPAP